MLRSAITESKILRKKAYIGLDISFILELALKGKLNRIEQGYVALGRNGVSGSGKIYNTYRNGLLNWFLPLHEFGSDIWSLSASFPFRVRLIIAIKIVNMNLISFLHQIKTVLKQRFCEMGG